MTEQEKYMAQALALAREAAAAGEVPVGCVIVRGGEIVGRGRNRREEKQSTASHAEMEAIAMANDVTGSWRLDDCTLYVTLEPCPMCAGAILNARIPRVYYGARDRAMGACGGVLESNGGTITVHGCAERLHAPAAPLHGHNDHRVVMSLAVLAAAAGLPLTVDDAEAIQKSWPGFFADAAPLGVEVEDA